MTGRRATRLICLSAVAVLATSCASTPSSSSDPPAGQVDPSGDATGPNAAAGAVADESGTTSAIPAGETLATFTPTEAVHIASVACADAIEQARFAELRAENADVKAFAKLMIDDHTRTLKNLSGVTVGSTGPDPTSALLERQDQLVALDLQLQPDAAVYELAYMTAQVAAQAKMIALLDRSLLPSVATARAIRAVLLAERSMYVGHLVKTLDLQQRVLRSALTAGATDTAGGGRGDPGSSLRIMPHK